MMYKEFKVKDIIPPISIRKYARKPTSKGNVPFVSCQTTNNGIASYCGETPQVNHCITVSTNGNCFDCFYHDYPIIPSTDVEVLSKKGITDNREIALYLCALLSPNTKLYSYSNKPKNGKVFNTKISLPVIKKHMPDFKILSGLIDAGGIDMSKIDTSTWKEFCFLDIFNIQTTRGIDKNKVQFDSNGKFDFIGRTSENWGVQGKLNALEYPPNPGKTFSLIQIGETMALWRENAWYASQNLFILIPKYNEMCSVPLFFQAVINKTMSKYGKDYNSYPTLKSLQDEKILLPTKDEYIPDWEYMKSYVSELERERVSELDAYLRVTGLDDYELTIEDEIVLKVFFKNDVSFKKFKLGELFSSENGNTDIKKENINKKGECVVSAGVENRGIIGKTDLPAKIITETAITVDMFGNVFYRDEPFKMVTHARVFSLIPNGFKLDRYSAEYFEGQIRKITSGYEYNNMCSFTKIKDETIDLPTNEDGSINWTYIYIYIRALEKKTIKNLVAWKDQELRILKSIV